MTRFLSPRSGNDFKNTLNRLRRDNKPFATKDREFRLGIYTFSFTLSSFSRLVTRVVYIQKIIEIEVVLTEYL